jgi:hypothetical protein
LQEEWQESNEEDQENRFDATLDPIKDRDQVVATRLAKLWIARGVDLADSELLVQRTDIEYCKQNYS